MGITEVQYDAAIAARDQARHEAFELKTKLEMVQMELARARQDANHYRRHWNSATAELKRMMDRACRKKSSKRGKH